MSPTSVESTLDAPSIDVREQNHYHKLASTWWDASGPFWPLHRLNQHRVQWIVDQLSQAGATADDLEQPLHGLRVLDVGCGGGILAESLAALGADVTGIDVVERNIEIARSHAESASLAIDYRLQTAEALASEGAQFDVVFNMEVVEHVADLPSFMNACSDLIKPDGFTFVATINRTLKAWLFAIVGAEYVLRWLPRGTHHFRMLRKPEEVRDLLTARGVKPVKWTGVSVNPLTRQFSFQPSRSVNYMLMARKGGK